MSAPEFLAAFLDDWKPDICLMATYGQKIPTALIHYPKLDFHNFQQWRHLVVLSRPRPHPRHGAGWAEASGPDHSPSHRRD